jgi:hypothetical protein
VNGYKELHGEKLKKGDPDLEAMEAKWKQYSEDKPRPYIVEPRRP